MRKKRLLKNTISSLVYQFTAIICGFILPRLILDSFGSDVNGLVYSIMQFLQIIAFLELGVGVVVQSALYKPLAEKNKNSISEIIVSAGKFFKRLANILLIYNMALIVVYPLIINQNFDYLYTATLIAAISISSFAQYYFGVVDRLLLTADQKAYIQYNAQTLTLILNTVACVALIKFGASIQIIKLTTSLIYLARPFLLRLYVDRKYSVNRKITYDSEPIHQKWNGVAQHVAAVVLDSTDTIVLTFFATLSDVSIYSVYFLVVYGIKQLFISMTNGIQSLIGELWAKQELNKLKNFFGWSEWLIHIGTVFVFGCTSMLIVPFVQVYTKGITDANYFQPIFAAVFVLAHACHCLRLPYNLMILAGGHYKETQKSYIFAAIINIVVSVGTVKLWGLVGVAIGTLVAMGYQTLWMANYNSKNLLEWPIKNFIKQLATDGLCVVLGILFSSWLKIQEYDFISWVILALKTGLIWGTVIYIVNYVLYKDKIRSLLKFERYTSKVNVKP